MRTVFPAFCTDEAADWLQQLDPRRGMAPVDRALSSVADSADPRASAGRAEIALVAAELVAALHGQPHPALPVPGVEWVDAQGGPHAVRTDGDFDALVMATRALDLIVTSSQLSDARVEPDADDSWRAALDDLRMRLATAGGMPRSPVA
ncbi:MAG: DUF4259 domain-containing protein [Gemmatimonadaceae bacterium]